MTLRPIATSLTTLLVLLGLSCQGGSGGSSPAAGPPAQGGAAGAARDLGPSLATVNGQAIGGVEFDQAAARKMGRDGEVAEADRRAILDELVEEKLLYQEALRRGIDKDPKIQKMMVNTLLKEQVYTGVRTADITEQELQQYFEAHKEDFVVPEKVQIKTILIRAQDNEAPDAVRARAEQVRQEVVARPADFKDLAQKYSVGPYARRGGDLGYVTREGKPGVDPQLVEAAFALAKGGVSGLVQTADGWNIVHVPNKRERVERTFQQMRGSVLRKLKSENYQKMYDDFVGDLKKGADVQVDAAAVLSRKIDPPQAAVGDRAFPPGAPGDLAGPEGAPEGPPLAPPAPGAAAELREDEEESQ